MARGLVTRGNVVFGKTADLDRHHFEKDEIALDLDTMTLRQASSRGLGSSVLQNAGGGVEDYGLRLRKTLNAAVNPGFSGIDISWDVAEYNDVPSGSLMWTTGTDVTIRKAGKYLVTANVQWAGTEITGWREIQLLKNGVVIAESKVAAVTDTGDGESQSLVTVDDFAKDDVIKVHADQDNANAPNAINVLGGAAGTPTNFTAQLLQAA